MTALSAPSLGRLAGVSRSRIARQLAGWITPLLFWAVPPAALAQTNQIPPVAPGHQLLRGDAPPGLLGAARLIGSGPPYGANPVVGYFQPVAISAPAGSQLALSDGGMFQPPMDGPLHAALMIGPAYRFEITGAPGQPDAALYPTVELIDRTYPPPGKEVRFAIPIVIDEDDLRAALAGYLVTRVIYLEDPQTALPEPDPPGTQRSFDVRGDQDPLHVADAMGRPVAVLRIGSLLPPDDPTQMYQFLLGSPPWKRITAPPSGLEGVPVEGAITRTPNVPRDDVPAGALPWQLPPSGGPRDHPPAARLASPPLPASPPLR
jgi:hypothetical protein